MKSKLILLGLIMMGAVAFSCAGRAAQKSPEKPAAKPQKPLIRIDLLLKKEIRKATPKRDLFSPQAISRNEVTPLVMPQVRTSVSSEEKPGIESGIPPLNMNYIGFSYNRTKKKYIALVMFEGQVIAVAEGETLGPSWKLLRITASEIEVQGLDGKTQKFGLEGERK